MPKVILISQFPLPYSKIGSWPTMYKNYFESGDHQIDYIICEQPEQKFDSVNYEIVPNDFWFRLRRRWHKYYRLGYLDALKKVLNKKDKFVIQVVDNYKIVFRIHQILVAMGIRERCYIQSFYHGFAPFLSVENTHNFYEIIDELVLLTSDAYKEHLRYYSAFPCKVSYIYNGIDTKKFCKIESSVKSQLKKELGFTQQKIFLWCSNDRPKKGLKLLLDAWKRLYPKHQDIVLLVIGSKSKTPVPGVVYLGSIPNDDLPKYYQISDCYLFPTLCHEGFGLSLVEALNCGCYCIASALGGVPEVLQYGKLGKLIESPNFVSHWVRAMDDYLNQMDQPIVMDAPIYSAQEWNTHMNEIIQEAKISLS
ncbi:MAG: glycosyltransferase family 4 protein [Bacteroidetes bacterium]|nr:glycosyltransferase family 4 protein [Bacteroidota bacterium]